MSRYPEGLVEWVRAHYLEMDNEQLAAGVSKEFDYPMNAKAMNSLKKNHKISGGPRIKTYHPDWPKEICDFIKANYKGMGHKAMAELVAAEFGKEYTAAQIKGFYARNKLNSGLTGHFVKGQPSHNKGIPMSPDVYARCKATMFKKGNRPHNALPVGTEVIRTDGYHQTKTGEPDKWELTHVLMWQQAYGEIPENCHISFKDGNRDHIELSNLFLETFEEHLELNRRGLRSSIPEYTETGLSIARLNIAIHKRRKSDNGKKNKEDKPMAKRTKEKPVVLTSDKFKEIKRMDKTGMEKYLNEIYFRGSRAQAAAGFDVDKALERIGQIKGIGSGKMEQIKQALIDSGGAYGND